MQARAPFIPHSGSRLLTHLAVRLGAPQLLLVVQPPHKHLTGHIIHQGALCHLALPPDEANIHLLHGEEGEAGSCLFLVHVHSPDDADAVDLGVYASALAGTDREVKDGVILQKEHNRCR